MRNPAPQDSDLVVYERLILLSGVSFSNRLAHTFILHAAGRTSVQYGSSRDRSILLVLCYDENEMGGTCSAYGGEVRCVQGFGGET